MIKVSSVTKLYGQQKALDDVSFTINPGEIVGLLGPNGAGKSTLMKIITCFIPPSEGDVTVCGNSIFDNPRAVCRDIGYLPEHNPLYTDMYIPEFLHFVAGLYGMKNSRQRTDEVIEMTGLGPEMGKKIGMLSKGYRQRVGLAQALIHDPRVLILDEPTTGLDPNQLEEIRTLIRNIGRSKIVLLSTHIMQEVEAMCSRAIIINHGKIIADDSTAALHNANHSSNLYTVEFEQPIDIASLKHLKGVAAIRQMQDNTYSISAVSDTDIREGLFRWAVTNHHTILTVTRQQDSLEQIFQKLTAK